MTSHLIIGGGPAGSYLAYLLARRGERVDLYERNADQVRNPKPCAGGIHRWWVERTKVPLPDDMVAAPIQRALVFYGDRLITEVGGRGSILGYVIRRGAFERYLQEEAERMGARVVYEAKHTIDGYDRVYLAEGAAGTVKKSLGLSERRPPDDFHVAVQVIGSGDEPQEGALELYFDDLVPGGYAWRFPGMIPGTRDSAVEVGLGVPAPMGGSAWGILERWMDRMGIRVRPAVRHAHIIPTSRPQRQAFGRVMVLGDDAYLTNPVTGGGIHSALLSALSAADGKPVPRSFRIQSRILYAARNRIVSAPPAKVASVIRSVGPSLARDDREPPYRLMVRLARAFISMI
jgi:digeranylgeranylglycerophospholipid reductase